MIRFDDLRLDAGSIKTLPDGGIKVVGQLTHTGVFKYRNTDGTERREYRPKEEVFTPAAIESFAALPVTVTHPSAGKVTPSTFKSLAVGYLGENIRQDGHMMVADIYIRDESAVADVKAGRLKHLSCGYKVAYDPTPGTTESGERYDGVQRGIVGNHVALLPAGMPPRGGSECVLRLDANNDEIYPGNSAGPNSDVPENTESLTAQVAALTGELKTARTDAATATASAAEATRLTAEVARLTEELSPARLDALVEVRLAVVASAKAAGVESKGKTSIQIKREIVAKKTPSLAARVDSMDDTALSAVMAVYAEAPHPSLVVAGGLTTPPVDGAPRTDAGDKRVTSGELYAKSLKDRRNMFLNSKGDLA